VVSIPQSEQTVRVSVREIPAAAGPEPGRADAPARLDLQGLHRLGLFVEEEELFAGGKDELSTAICTGQ